MRLKFRMGVGSKVRFWVRIIGLGSELGLGLSLGFGLGMGFGMRVRVRVRV